MFFQCTCNCSWRQERIHPVVSKRGNSDTCLHHPALEDSNFHAKRTIERVIKSLRCFCRIQNRKRNTKALSTQPVGDGGEREGSPTSGDTEDLHVVLLLICSSQTKRDTLCWRATGRPFLIFARHYANCSLHSVGGTRRHPSVRNHNVTTM